MKKLLYIFFTIFIISCTEEAVKPELSFHERLKQFINSSEKVGISNSSQAVSPNSRLSTKDEILSEISFEIYDESVIPEIEALYREYANPNLDFDKVHDLLYSIKYNSNGRIEECTNKWIHRVYSNGCESMMACSNCSGDWDCAYNYIYCP